jgi:hypothetical protein
MAQSVYVSQEKEEIIMSWQYKSPCVGLLSTPDHTCTSTLNAGQIDGKGLATGEADAKLSQISLNERPQQDLIPSEVDLEERALLSDHKSESETKPQWPILLSWLGQCWQGFVDSFSLQPELKIRQRRDRQGNLWWIVYDPITDQSAQLATEAEVRWWIEQFYRHRFRASQRPW